MTKRCNLCAKKLNEEGRCVNEKCPTYIKEQIISTIEDNIKEGADNA